MAFVPAAPALLSAVLLLAACGEPKTTAPAPQRAAAPAAESAPAPGAVRAIAWFEGDVTEAFARAQATGRPIFLYWGAVWCPPCNIIKTTVFSDPEFVRQTEAFVAVYLDGDSDGAQRWGEHFGTIGYPTLIVFDARGQEMTRLSSGMAPRHYRDVLTRALDGQRSIGALLTEARRAPGELNEAEWRALAQYAWAVDAGRLLPEEARAAGFAELAAASPYPPISRRFALLSALADRPALAQGPAPRALAAQLEAMLGSADEVRQNLEELQYDGAELIALACAEDADMRQRLNELYRRQMNATLTDDSLPLMLRIKSLYGLIGLQEAAGEAIDAPLQAQVQAQVAALRELDLTPQQRQALLPTAASLLSRSGRPDLAIALLEDELEGSLAPYYFMSYLAKFNAESGHPAAAVDWARKAWEAARGPATRTQWGLSYLQRLLALQPDNTEAIAGVLGGVFDNLAAHPDAFYQRSRMRLEQKLPALRDWSAAAGDRALAAAAPAIARACEKQPADSPTDRLCGEYLRLAQGPGSAP